MSIEPSSSESHTNMNSEANTKMGDHEANGQVMVKVSGGFVCMPEEILVITLSYLSEKDMLNCSRAFPLFRRMANTPSLWKMKCEREGKYEEKFMAPYCPSNWQKFYMDAPFSRNLMKNPSGKDEFQHWLILRNCGSKWAAEPNNSFGGGVKPPELLAVSEGEQCNFATSYGWCCKCQIVDLIKEGFEEDVLDTLQPPFKVGEWYAARYDCGNVYCLEVKLLKVRSEEDLEDVYDDEEIYDDDDHIYEDEATGQEMGEDVIDSFRFQAETQQWESNDWKEISHVFKDYGPGLRFIRFCHRSKDTKFWDGHYGSKMAGSYVRVSFEK